MLANVRIRSDCLRTCSAIDKKQDPATKFRFEVGPSKLTACICVPNKTKLSIAIDWLFLYVYSIPCGVTVLQISFWLRNWKYCHGLPKLGLIHSAEDRCLIQQKWHANIILLHHSDVIMSAMAFQITGVFIVCSTVCSGVDQRKYQSPASLAFIGGIHRWPVDSPHKNNAENVSIWWHHHGCDFFHKCF